MTFCHIERAAFILRKKGNEIGKRGDKQALVTQTHFVSFVQGATSEIGCNQSLTLTCREE